MLKSRTKKVTLQRKGRLKPSLGALIHPLTNILTNDVRIISLLVLR
jgi:hypothetical protein